MAEVKHGVVSLNHRADLIGSYLKCSSDHTLHSPPAPKDQLAGAESPSGQAMSLINASLPTAYLSSSTRFDFAFSWLVIPCSSSDGDLIMENRENRSLGSKTCCSRLPAAPGARGCFCRVGQSKTACRKIKAVPSRIDSSSALLYSRPHT